MGGAATGGGGGRGGGWGGGGAVGGGAEARGGGEAGGGEAGRGRAEGEDGLLGSVAGKAGRGVEAVIGGHELLDRFVTIQTADDAPSKPHPAMVQQAMAETGVEPADTVVIGDTTFDMEMARAAGAGAIGVGGGYHPPHALPAAGAETVLTTFNDLPSWLDRRWVSSETTQDIVREGANE